MEEFSIVKRRRKESLESFGGRPSRIGVQVLPENELIEIPSSVLKISSNNMEKDPYQYALVKSSHYVKYFLNGDSSVFSLDMQKRRDGRLFSIFNSRKWNL